MRDYRLTVAQNFNLELAWSQQKVLHRMPEARETCSRNWFMG